MLYIITYYYVFFFFLEAQKKFYILKNVVNFVKINNKIS